MPSTAKAKLTPAEKRRKIAEARAKANRWAREQKRTPPTSKKRKAAVSPQSSPSPSVSDEDMSPKLYQKPKVKIVKGRKSISGKRAPKKSRQGDTPPPAESKAKRSIATGIGGTSANNIFPQNKPEKSSAKPSSAINPYKKTTAISRNIGSSFSRSSGAVATTKTSTATSSSSFSSSVKSVIVPSKEPIKSSSTSRYKPIAVTKKAVSYEEDYSVGGESELPAQESLVNPPQHSEFEEDNVAVASNEHVGEQEIYEDSLSISKARSSAISLFIRVTKAIGAAACLSLVLAITFYAIPKQLSGNIAGETEKEEKTYATIPPCFNDTFENLNDLEKALDGNLSLSDPIVRNYTDEGSESFMTAGKTGECLPAKFDGSFLPCPAGGRCYDGFLVDCKADPSFSTDEIGSDLLRVSADNRSCQLTLIGQQVSSEIKSSLSSFTIDHICNCKFLSPFFIGVDSSLEKDAIVSNGRDEQPVILFGISSIVKNLRERLASTDVEMLSDIQWSLVDGEMVKKILRFDEGDELFLDAGNAAVGFNANYMNNKISLPFSCWTHLALLDAASFLAGLFARTTIKLLGLVFQITTTYPLLSLCIMCIFWIMTFVRQKKQKKEFERSQIVEIRESAYDMLIHAEESYAVVHLRDTIMHKMYPMSLKDRKAAALKLWPKVVKDVQHDSRVRKIEKNVMGSRQEHWEWISVPARKQRLSIATPVRNPFLSNDSESPSLENLKKNLL